MKQRLYVPVMNCAVNKDNREQYKTNLNKLGADTVFVALERDAFFARGKERAKYLSHLKENVDYFRAQGFRVGVWFCVFGTGKPLTEREMEISKDYTSIRSVTGREGKDKDMFCPENPVFVNDFCSFVKELALISDMLMIDDDLCLSVRPGLGCFCDEHLKMLESEVGEKLELSTLKNLLFVGGKNKYRTAWLNNNKKTLIKFAKAVRNAVNDVNPNIRVGFCAGFTSFDIEGADAVELTKALAGDTTPFLRFTGAPYWVSPSKDRFRGQPLSAIVEETRRQEAFCRDSGVEIFFEADTYPRPRYVCSSSLLECFSLPLHASGGMGEQGYFLDYHSSPEYETGYVEHRLYNAPLYEFIHKNFDDKTCCGVKAFGNIRKIENADLIDGLGETAIMTGWFNRGAEFLSVIGVPTHYEQSGDCGIAFGEEAREIDKPLCKMIVDIKGALILQEKGFDLGLKGVESIGSPAFEWFDKEKVLLSYGASNGYYSLDINKKAKVLSTFELPDGTRYPSAYTYTADGVEYLVYAFDCEKLPHRASVMFSYKRAEQVKDFVKNICYLEKAPFVYQLCKKADNQTALLFVNMGENPVINGKISLDDKYSSFEIFGASANLLGDKLILNGMLAPYSAFAIVLKK